MRKEKEADQLKTESHLELENSFEALLELESFSLFLVVNVRELSIFCSLLNLQGA